MTSTYSESLSMRAGELASTYKSALDALIKNRNRRDHLHHLFKMLCELTYSERRGDIRKIWWFASAMVESLRDGGLVFIEHHIQIFKLIHHELKKVSLRRTSKRSESQIAALLKALAIEVMASSSNGELTGEVQAFLNKEK